MIGDDESAALPRMQAVTVFHAHAYAEKREHDPRKDRRVPDQETAARPGARGEDRENTGEKDVCDEEGDDSHLLEQCAHRINGCRRIIEPCRGASCDGPGAGSRLIIAQDDAVFNGKTFGPRPLPRRRKR